MTKTTTTGGASSDRIKNDPAFERTRENMAEFGRAGKAAKLIRTIFRDVTINGYSWDNVLKVWVNLIRGFDKAWVNGSGLVAVVDSC